MTESHTTALQEPKLSGARDSGNIFHVYDTHNWLME